MHIQRLPIPSIPAHRRRNDNELILSDEIANAAFFRCGFVARMRLDFEFERGDEGEEEGEEQPEGQRCRHGWWLWCLKKEVVFLDLSPDAVEWTRRRDELE